MPLSAGAHVASSEGLYVRSSMRAQLVVGIAVSVFAGAVSGPVVNAHAATTAVPYFREYERASWLLAPDIVVNPPGPVAGAVLPAPVERGYVITGEHLRNFEVTGSDAADAELRALVDRVSTDENGRALDTTGYRVFVTPPIVAVQHADAAKRHAALLLESSEDPNALVADVTHAAPVGTDAVDDAQEELGLSELFVLPVGVGVGEIGAAWDEGRIKVTTLVQEVGLTPPADPVAGEAEVDPQWDPQAKVCLSRKSNNTAYYDPCYQYATLARDGDPNRTSWTHHQHGTGKSKGVWTLVTLTVESARTVTSTSPAQTWLDWSPSADVNMGNCKPYELGIQVYGVVFTRMFTTCDEWDITKGNPSVNFKVEWDGQAWRKDRSVAGMKTFGVANGLRARNNTRYDYEAW
ncbi:MAG TPA: hypothetical protein VNQ77_15940 [Frankiaceae bacterium]|nr:hypothetical protein [Frankiaceae bacterium]